MMSRLSNERSAAQSTSFLSITSFDNATSSVETSPKVASLGVAVASERSCVAGVAEAVELVCLGRSGPTYPFSAPLFRFRHRYSNLHAVRLSSSARFTVALLAFKALRLFLTDVRFEAYLCEIHAAGPNYAAQPRITRHQT